MAERLRRPEHPVTLTWSDAQAFIARLNERESHRRCRLPTEAEWEYAARAGTRTRSSFGNDVSQLGRCAWYGEVFATGWTHPVGRKLPKPWGLHDMHGNVWERVQDGYAEGCFASSPPIDPTGPAAASAHTGRGGSWHVTSGSWRSAVRKPYDADHLGISIGFRLAMTAER